MRSPEEILLLLEDAKSRSSGDFYKTVLEVTQEEANQIASLPEDEKNKFRFLLEIPLKINSKL